MENWTETELKEYESRYKAVTIPVQVRIQGKQRILNLKEVKKILRAAQLIALGDCSCRNKVKKCDAPLDTCLSLNKKAESLISKGLVTRVNLERALKTLERAHEAGLVHITYTIRGKENPEYICSCCSCCCHSLAGLIRFGILGAVVPSKYVARDISQSCINCGKCVQRCPFKARTMEDGKMNFDKTKCFGCGLCASTCPSGSINLVLRRKGARSRRVQKIVTSVKSLRMEDGMT